ncbi:bifunctional ADP-dependent NAD(P)H-hydrate dehydratase/NAD(P)H-hydrate epimerase, partial [Pseudomonas coleopterorum]|nr:bifunctional ADP-dependent NAD(P)H-hydrate dehydratase/NAD(P)H-hydrate epimerase [Pseudomonas coleopterorum]
MPPDTQIPDVVHSQPAAAVPLTPASLPVLSARPLDAHKGMYGRVLVIGGDHGTGGAALLSAQSALRSGAGMV